METFWKNIKSNLAKGYQSVSEKAGDLTKIGRIKLEIIALKRDIERLFIELGGRVYQAFVNKSQKDLLEDKKITNLVKLIENKEKKLQELERKVQQIREQRVGSEAQH